MKPSVIILLAAGKHARMNSELPAPLHNMCGRMLIDWVMNTACGAFDDVPAWAVVPSGGLIEAQLGARAQYAVQKDALGEANALKCALNAIDIKTGQALVLFANYPTIKKEMLTLLSDAVAGGAKVASVVCTDEENDTQRHPGAFCFDIAALRLALEKTGDALTLGEFVQGFDDAAYIDYHETECIRIVDRRTLWANEHLLNSRIVAAHMKNGVTIIDVANAHIGADVSIARDTLIYPNVFLSGKTHIGEGCIIKPGCQINNTEVGNGCTLTAVVANEAKLGNNVSCGPFVNLRPGTVLQDGCKVGDFVEIKNSTVGEGTKLPHLSYIGDADIGARVNVGCGSVVVNYDGHEKHRTKVGDNVFIGCQTALVAPVSIGDGAFTAAGSTITEDVPAGAMAFARSKQVNKANYAHDYRERRKKEKDNK